METKPANIKIEAAVNAPIIKTWEYFTNPEHIVKWNHASDDWHSPKAENDLREGGKFVFRMEAKDGSFGFDFEGIYDAVIPLKHIEYSLGDGRKVSIDFSGNKNATFLTETFDAENTNPVEMQQAGWQSILDNFKKYTEAN